MAPGTQTVVISFKTKNINPEVYLAGHLSCSEMYLNNKQHEDDLIVTGFGLPLNIGLIKTGAIEEPLSIER